MSKEIKPKVSSEIEIGLIERDYIRFKTKNKTYILEPSYAIRYGLKCEQCRKTTKYVISEHKTLILGKKSTQIISSKPVYRLCFKCFLKTGIITKEELEVLRTYISLL